METLEYLEDQVRTINRGLKYTLEEYAERIYESPSVKHVKNEVCGEHDADHLNIVEEVSHWD